jgi:predicted ABC-type transport system involved in lysophospholipase L1 biosynthesis ATPase subunit
MFERLPQVALQWVTGPQEALAVLAGWNGPQNVVVSRASVLRANLTAAENIAWVPMFLQNLNRAQGLARAQGLLDLLGLQAVAGLRDAQLSTTERAAVLLLQSLAGRPVVHWVIDRPAALLPDAFHPQVLSDWLTALAPHYQRCTVLDYDWNAPLYRPLADRPAPHDA